MIEQVLQSSAFSDPSELPKVKNIFYRCLECGERISSVPSKSIGCKCGNISIDIDMMRFCEVDDGQYEVVIVK